MLVFSPNMTTEKPSQLGHNLEKKKAICEWEKKNCKEKNPLEYKTGPSNTSRNVATGPMDKSSPMKNSRSKSFGVKPARKKKSPSSFISSFLCAWLLWLRWRKTYRKLWVPAGSLMPNFASWSYRRKAFQPIDRHWSISLIPAAFLLFFIHSTYHQQKRLKVPFCGSWQNVKQEEKGRDLLFWRGSICAT